MRYRVWMVLLLVTVLTGCSVTVPESIEDKISQTKDSVMDKVESSVDSMMEKAESSLDQSEDSLDQSEDSLGQEAEGSNDFTDELSDEDIELSDDMIKNNENEEIICDIRFEYHNSFYGYDLEASWDDAAVKMSNTNLSSEINGLELLMDGTTELFSELDLDESGDISLEEWGEINVDFPLADYDSDYDGLLNEIELACFSQYIGGIDVYPSGYSISQPEMEGYVIEQQEEPVSIKILRASTAGYTGPYQTYFPFGTVFIELSSDYEITMPEAEGMEVTMAFDYPLMSMYLTDGKEVIDSYSHGALGFTSIVDTGEFNAIFSGDEYQLQYEAYYEGQVVGTYELIITPKN